VVNKLWDFLIFALWSQAEYQQGSQQNIDLLTTYPIETNEK